MRVLLQLRPSPAAAAAALAVAPEPALTAGVAANVPGLMMDHTYPPVRLPAIRTLTGAPVVSLSQPLTFGVEPAAATYLVRGVIPDEAVTPTYTSLLTHPDVVGVFSDPTVATCLTCAGTPAVGTAADVAQLLGVPALQAAGMDGSGVLVAVVDVGINLAYLQGKGLNPLLDVANSFTPAGVQTAPGQHDVAHGTMCAFDVGIAAPKATLLDHAVLLSTTPGATFMSGLLSDAVLAYSKLLQLLAANPAPAALVVTNSWGMFSPDSDFPPGHPGNYSDNPNHPFNVIVASLENAGADILFAAGNCGRDCPDGRCAFAAGDLPICGANSHPRVLTVAGVDINKQRVGYSSQGPGRLAFRKPDIAAYTHFDGSGVFAPEPDSGTSAACPVAAGVVAAVRSKYPSATLSPAQLRSLLFKTAEDRGPVGFDDDYGWGVITPTAVQAALAADGGAVPVAAAAAAGPAKSKRARRPVAP